MSKLLHATKYAIEHRGEDTVQLFQGDVMATSKGGVKVVFTSVDRVTHSSLLPTTCENSVLGTYERTTTDRIEGMCSSF